MAHTSWDRALPLSQMPAPPSFFCFVCLVLFFFPILKQGLAVLSRLREELGLSACSTMPASLMFYQLFV